MADNQQLAAALSGTIKATPRNPVLGGVADLLGMAYKLPEMPRLGVPGIDLLMANRNKVLDLLGMGDVQKTAEALSYGNAIGTGKGMTYRPKDETINAALAVAPMVGLTAKAASAGAMAAGRAGERFAERYVPMVMERGGLGAEMLQGMGRSTVSPMDVYHGSPHTFPPTPRNSLGEFDASKIGTGEGAQAFGHGIYTAEAPGVAKGYAEQLSTAKGPLGDVAKYWRKNGGEDAFRSFAKDAGLPPAEIENTANVIRNTGNLYKVDLPDEKIAKMLDWDKPLSQQPNILKVLEKNYRSDYLNMFKNLPGSDFYKAISGNEGIEDLRVLGSSELTKIGIPGIKYLDEGSRSAGKGTRNFVVFPGEEKSMTILERNAKKP